MNLNMPILCRSNFLGVRGQLPKTWVKLPKLTRKAMLANLSPQGGGVRGQKKDFLIFSKTEF